MSDPTRPVREILRDLRRRYHRSHLTERPPLDQPAAIAALLRPGELVALAQASYWPIPPSALAWIAEPPRARARRRRRQANVLAAPMRRMLADELPAAFEYLLRTRGDDASD